jgi:hypothetical protein
MVAPSQLLTVFQVLIAQWIGFKFHKFTGALFFSFLEVNLKKNQPTMIFAQSLPQHYSDSMIAMGTLPISLSLGAGYTGSSITKIEALREDLCCCEFRRAIASLSQQQNT